MDYYQFGQKIRKEVKMSNAHKPSKPRACHREHYRVARRKKANCIRINNSKYYLIEALDGTSPMSLQTKKLLRRAGYNIIEIKRNHNNSSSLICDDMEIVGAPPEPKPIPTFPDPKGTRPKGKKHKRTKIWII